jgi:triosephosphate isomerase
MRPKLVVGNWKMNGSRAANASLLAGIVAGLDNANATCAVCVPAPYLQQCADTLAGGKLAWGAQDVSVHASGAYTGEVAASMLLDFGCSYVIVGHSERRAYHGETDQVVAQKTLAALNAGLTPIVCVGETLEQREAGQTNVVVDRQLSAVLELLDVDAAARIVVAYEPVWAIGTGRTATPELAQEAHEFVKTIADVPVLYGGSVKPENAGELLSMPAVDGALVGGASLEPDSFLAICQAAASLS